MEYEVLAYKSLVGDAEFFKAGALKAYFIEQAEHVAKEKFAPYLSFEKWK